MKKMTVNEIEHIEATIKAFYDKYKSFKSN